MIVCIGTLEDVMDTCYLVSALLNVFLTVEMHSSCHQNHLMAVIKSI
jgi:hypothetical protein